MTPVQTELSENELLIYYPDCDNLRLCIPWTIPNVGNKMLTTGTLLQTTRPYVLSVELARGLCASIRNQASDWETLGLDATKDFWNTIQDAGRYLFHAIKLSYNNVDYDFEIDKYANYSMQLCTKASLILAKRYIERVLLLRKIAKQSADAAAALSSSHSLAIREEAPVVDEDDIFDENSVTQMLQDLENDPTLGRTSSVYNIQDEDGNAFDADDDDDDDVFDISSDDTAVHVIEAVTPKFVGVHLDYHLLEKEVKSIFFETFNHVNIDMAWNEIHAHPELLNEYDQQIEWCYSNGFSVTAGPIINFFPLHLPDFLMRYKGDFEAVCNRVRDYVERLVKRYRMKVTTWVATSRVNSFFPLGLTLLQQLELTVKVVGWIHEFQPTAEVLTSLDLPWGDNILPPPFGVADEDSKIYPTIVCADYLLRAKCKIAGFQLEFNIGYQTLSTYDRPLLDWSRLIDRWSHFGVPLYLQIRLPSSCEFDKKALIPNPPMWNGWTMRYQALWASNVIPVLLSKPNVYGIDWCVFRDYRPHDYPNAGLISIDGRVKRTQIILAEILKYFMADMDV